MHHTMHVLDAPVPEIRSNGGNGPLYYRIYSALKVKALTCRSLDQSKGLWLWFYSRRQPNKSGYKLCCLAFITDQRDL